MSTTKGYRHPDGSHEIVTFTDNTATARAFYANSTEISVASAQAALDAADAAKPRGKSPFDKLVDLMEADGLITKQKADLLRGS